MSINLSYIQGCSEARGGVFIRILSAFKYYQFLVLHIVCATMYYKYYGKLDNSQLYYLCKCSYLCRYTNYYAAAAVNTWKITLGDYS